MVGSQLNGLKSGSVHLQTRQVELHSIAVSAAAKTFKTAHNVSKQSAARSPKQHGIWREIARDSQPEDPTTQLAGDYQLPPAASNRSKALSLERLRFPGRHDPSRGCTKLICVHAFQRVWHRALLLPRGLQLPTYGGFLALFRKLTGFSRECGSVRGIRLRLPRSR
jgi:hypothetical protein